MRRKNRWNCAVLLYLHRRGSTSKCLVSLIFNNYAWRNSWIPYKSCYVLTIGSSCGSYILDISWLDLRYFSSYFQTNPTCLLPSELKSDFQYINKFTLCIFPEGINWGNFFWLWDTLIEDLFFNLPCWIQTHKTKLKFWRIYFCWNQQLEKCKFVISLSGTHL